MEQMQELLSGLKSAPPQLAEVVVRGLAEGWPKDHRIVATKELESGLTALLERVPAGGRGKLLQLDDVEVARRFNAVTPNDRDSERDFLCSFLTAAGSNDDDVASARFLAVLRI